ncbi:hypothetical protein AAFF_G00214200 [Aldrovandia affinis]|uniref:Uncharacterized protein n=1 Tax=Aldrovandia affinis TaxID=143900 RepID=A0AAD7W587_9TELE|nr:hypothetical protein AAFF_G00214200 [Aldrovandia affinis]
MRGVSKTPAGAVSYGNGGPVSARRQRGALATVIERLCLQEFVKHSLKITPVCSAAVSKTHTPAEEIKDIALLHGRHYGPRPLIRPLAAIIKAPSSK